MKRFKQLLAQGLAALLLLSGVSVAEGVRELSWDDLMLDTGFNLPPQGSGLRPDEMVAQDPFGEPDGPGGVGGWGSMSVGVVEALDGELVKLPGFIVPLEVTDDGKVSEFLLVPYFGACIHYPPPPPNQIVYVTSDEPIELESTWAPIWATGVLATETRTSQYAAASYTCLLYTSDAADE